MEGQVEVVREILRNNPTINVNCKNASGYQALHCASDEGHASIVAILLAHPDIKVNLKDSRGGTPLHYACFDGHASCARLLLADSRVKVNDYRGSTPLWWAAYRGHLDVIKCWIASEREVDLGTRGDYHRDAIGAAKKWKKTEVTLLERFKRDAVQTRHQVRLELGFLDDLAAEMFAIVVFVSDGLMQIRDTTTTTPAARFFSIASQLPLELQMVLCFRQVGSDKEIVPGKESEVAFKELARRL